jgi:hypothetical protein
MRFAKLQRVGPIPTRVSEGFTEDGTGSSKPKWAGSIPAEVATSSSSSWLRNLGSHPRKTGSNPVLDAMPPPADPVPTLRTLASSFNSTRGCQLIALASGSGGGPPKAARGGSTPPESAAGMEK